MSWDAGSALLLRIGVWVRSLTLAAAALAAAGAAGGGLDWRYVLKCGGTAILALSIKCLPSLITGGPPAFIACITAGAGEAVAGIAACVA